MGTEFVASHIWRIVEWDDLASRHPMLNSFVPNLVWLPSQIAKLSDREGGAVQRTLQAMAWAMFRDAPVAPHLRDVVEEAWLLLPEPPDVEPVDPEALNLFVATERFFATRRSRVRDVISALEVLESGGVLTKKVVASRYTAGLPHVGLAERQELARHLRRFVEA